MSLAIRRTLKNENAGVCCLCKELGKTSISISYCVECQENLCETCKNIHRVSKLSKHHSIIDRQNTFMENEHTKELFKLLSKYTHCTEHEGKLLEFYCKEDNMFLCLTCYLSHIKNCKHVLEIKQICAHEESIRRKIGNLKDDTLKLSRFAEQITDTLTAAKDVEQRESVDINARLQEIRTTVVKLTDSLEDSVQSQHRTILKQNRIQRSKLTDKLWATRDKLEMNLSLIERLLIIGSNRQLFVAFHKLTQELQQHEGHIIEGCKSYKTSVCKIAESDILSELLSMNMNDTERLVKVECQEYSPDFPVYKAARWYTTENLETKTVLGRCDQHYGPLYTCLLYVTNNTILLIDSRYGQCYLTNEQCDIIASSNFMPNGSEDVDFKRMPSSATVLHSGEIAISLPEEKKIYLVNSENLTKHAHINTTHKARSIHGLTNGDIAVAWDEPVAFGIISSETSISQWQLPDRLKIKEKVYFTEDTSGRPFTQFDYMAVDDWRSCVVQSSKEDPAVYCFDFKGNPKFCYKNPDLVQPNGIAIDKQGFIYICEEKNSSIHVVSDRGVLVQIIKEDCPARPLAIGFDVDRQRFAVSNSGLGFAGHNISFFRIMNMETQ